MIYSEKCFYAWQIYEIPVVKDLEAGAPDIRLGELAAILAAGVLRLQSSAVLSAGSADPAAPKITAESGENCLELPGETVLSGHTG